MDSDFKNVVNSLYASRAKIESLTKQVTTNRRFLNMVIHDMRSPTVSIQQFLQQSLIVLKGHRKMLKGLKVFHETQQKKFNDNLTRRKRELMRHEESKEEKK